MGESPGPPAGRRGRHTATALSGVRAVARATARLQLEPRALSYTPAAFLGAATCFGSGGKVEQSIVFVILSWVAGLALGYASEVLGKRIAKPA
ncbi:MAG: DUF1097 domain-containing protein [Pseudomonadota bacterium]|nr:DUF1097 domain-containing protein [Pseudomonadota bacterium]